MAGSPKKRARKAGKPVPKGEPGTNPSSKLAPPTAEVQAQLDALDAAELTPSERIALMGDQPIIDWLGDGHSLLGIAEAIGVPRQTLSDWLHSDPVRSARVRRAQSEAAHAYAERAELVLEQATTDLDIRAAVALSQQYRWRAKVIDPNTYGEKPVAVLPVDAMAALVDAVQQHREAAKLRMVPVDVVDVPMSEVATLPMNTILR